MKRTTRPAAALSAAAAAVLAFAAPAHAGFTKSVVLDSSYDATQPLTNGTVYVVENGASFLGRYDGKSGLAVAPGATVVIFVKEGQSLNARANNGDQGGAGGGAGIILPKDATLIVTGPGEVYARGGGGTSGGRYSQGTAGTADENTCTAGRGGAGGAGGAGGGAGIGGAGGSGGFAGIAPEETPRETNEETFDLSGKNGNPGGAGGDGGDAGTVYLLGTASLTVEAGGGGSEVNSVAQFAPGAKYDRGFWRYAFVVGGAAPGGEGAGGVAARAGIGGGGGGGGGGGSGGNGGYYCWLSGESGGSESEWPRGASGEGGKSADGTLDGGRYWPSDSVLKNDVDGGKAGAGGAAGANGTGGALYKFSTASFSGSVANDDKATIGVSDAPSAVRYDVFFDAGGGAPQSSTSVVLGVAVTNCIAAADVPVPTRFGKTFLGWFTEEDGAGTKWFDADGSVANAPEIYETVDGTTLYAAWRDEDLALWRVDLAGIEVGSGSVVLSLKAASAEKFAEAKKHLRVYASPTLPVPETADAIIAAPEIVDNGDGTGTATFPLDPDLGAQFYEIGVGD